MPNNSLPTPKYPNTANKGGLPTPKYPAANAKANNTKANAAPKKPAGKKPQKAKAMTKNELKKAISDKCGVTVVAAGEFLDALTQIALDQLGDDSVTDFSVPGLVKLKKKIKPARPAGNRMNPFTKQMQHVDAKPASVVIKATPLKTVKGVVS